MLCQIRSSDEKHRGCLAINAVTELVGTEHKLEETMVDVIKIRLSRLEKLLELAVARGELEADCDTRTKALVIKNSLIGLNVLSKVIHSEEELLSVAVQTLKSVGIYRQN
jgi:TetR/AcrR family transcriptional repressor of nem operon